MSKSVKNRLYSITASLCSLVLVATVILTVLRSTEQAWGAEMQTAVSGSQIVRQGINYLGTPYHAYTDAEVNKGVDIKKGFDCSNYVRQVFTDLGFRKDSSYTLPTGPWSWGNLTSFMYGGKMYEIENVDIKAPDKWQSGDVMFFGNSTNKYTHMAVYMGKYSSKDALVKTWGLTAEQAKYIVDDGTGGGYWRIHCIGNSNPGFTDVGFPYSVRIDNQLTGKAGGQYLTKMIRLSAKEKPRYERGNIRFEKSGKMTGRNIPNVNWRIYASMELAEQAISERDAGIDSTPYVESFTTAADGSAEFEIPNGSYYCIEWKTKTGSDLTNIIYSLEITDETRQKLTNDEWNLTVKIEKVDAENAELRLSGAEFTLYEYNDKDQKFYEAGKFADNGNGVYTLGSYAIHDDNGNAVKTISDGVLYYTESNIGLYRIDETRNPDGYIGEYVSYISINKDNNGKTLTYTVKNYKKYTPVTDETGYLRVYKVDAYDIQTPLEGGVFEVYKSAACDDASHIGQIHTGKDGYGKLIYYSEEDTDKTSPFEKELPAGSYYLKESYAPDGYFINQNVFKATVSANEVSVVTVADAPKPGYIVFLKFDEDSVTREGNGQIVSGTPLNNAVYNVYTDPECRNQAEYIEYSEDGTRIIETKEKAVLITDSEGKAQSKYLRPGTYYLKEINAPAGYALSTEVIKAEVPRNDYVYAYGTNKMLKNTLTIIKNDAVTNVAQGNASFAGAEFFIMAEADIINPKTGNAVYHKGNAVGMIQNADGTYSPNTTGGQSAASVVTDSQGRVTINGLPAGKYYVMECNAPEGYILDTNTWLHIDTTGSTPVIYYSYVDNSKAPVYADTSDYKDCANVTAYFSDEAITRTLVIHKTAADTGEVVEGVGFKLYRLSDVLKHNNISELPVTEDGEIDITRLELNGYEQTISSKGEDTVYTDAKGLAVVNGLLYEKYLIVEVSAPGDFLLAVPQTVDMAAGLEGQTAVISANTVSIVEKYFVDERASYNLLINKYVAEKDTTVHPETEASFELTDSNGNKIAAVSTVDGQGIIQGLKSGKYLLTETKAPSGYNILDKSIEIYVSTNEAYAIIGDTKLVLEKIRPAGVDNVKSYTYQVNVPNTTKKLIVSKADNSGNPLAGAELELYEAAPDGTKARLVESWITDGTKKAFEKLGAGSYVLSEKNAPEGYRLADDILFNLEDGYTAKEIVMTDYPENVKIPETEAPTEPLGPTEAPTVPEMPTNPAEPVPEETSVSEPQTETEPEKETKKPQAEPDEPDWTYDPVHTGDSGLMKYIMLMMISGSGVVVSVVLLVLNNRKITE